MAMLDKRGYKYKENLIQPQGLPRQDYAKTSKLNLDDVTGDPEE